MIMLLIPSHTRKSCAFAGRRDNIEYTHTEYEISTKYRSNIKMIQRLPEVLAHAMGNTISIAVFDTLEEVKEFFNYTLEKRK